MLIKLFLFFLFRPTHGSGHPGHGKPFGIGLDTVDVRVRTELPDPVALWEDHVHTSTPVLFKGVAEKFPSYNNFRNDTYLREKYGKWKISYEPTVKERRDKREKRMSLSKFTKVYQKNNYYMVSDIMVPNPLRDEIDVPKPLLCEDLAGRMETCIMWLSAGGTRSLLHSDSSDNFNCLYDGSKELWLAHPKHTDKFYYVDSKSTVDVDKVDYKKYKKLLQVPWYYAKMEAGDCLYLPYLWVHHIKSHGPRNFAVNIFWDHMKGLPNRKKCEEKFKNNKNETEKLNNFKISDKLESGRAQWILSLQNEPDNISEDRFCDFLHRIEELDQDECGELFSKLDADNNKRVTFVELYQSDISILKPFVQSMMEEDSENGGENLTYYEEVDLKKEEASDEMSSKDEL